VIQRLRASPISTGQDDFLVMGNQDFALSQFKASGASKPFSARSMVLV
jgi:hypothetical protein